MGDQNNKITIIVFLGHPICLYVPLGKNGLTEGLLDSSAARELKQQPYRSIVYSH